MNSEQWTSVVRAVLQLLLAPGSYLVLKGIVPVDQTGQIIPALTIVITIVGGSLLTRWGVLAHSPAAVAAAVASTPAVASAVVATVNSDAMPGVKVVSSTSSAPQVTVDPKGNVRPDPIQPVASKF